MTKARIYRPAKTAMQSGRAKTHDWRLEYDAAAARFVEPLMGWTGSSNTLGQLSLSFPTKEEAIAYAQEHQLDYEVEEPGPRVIPRRAYADNFAWGKVPTGAR